MSKKDLKHWRALQDDQPYLGHWSILALGVDEIEVTIESVYTKVVKLQNFQTRRMEDMNKLFIKLKEFDRPWIMNKVNPDAIEFVLGTHDPAQWVGKNITIFATTDKFGKETKPCIRVKKIKPKPIDLEPYKAQLMECGDIETLKSLYSSFTPKIKGLLRSYVVELGNKLKGGKS